MFLSKQERAELAMQRRQQAVEEERKRREEERESRAKYLEEARGQGSGGDRRRWEEGEHSTVVIGKDQEKEMDAIRSRYLGAQKKRKKVRRLADRKFVFDWDTAEDTSSDFNPMYVLT